MSNIEDRDIEQKIFTNIQSSPLSNGAPDFLLSSLIKLGRSYLQNKHTSYLGNAIKMMRPFAGSICRMNGINTYNEMIATDPEVAKSVGTLHLAATSNETQFGAPKTFVSKEDQVSADNAAEFMNQMVEQMDIPFDLERGKTLYDEIRYGNGIAELNYGKGYGKLKDYLVIKEVRTAKLDDVVFITDSFNRIIGYAPYGFPGVLAPLDSWMPADGFITYLFDVLDTQRKREDAILSTQMLPKYKCLHLQWKPISGDPKGLALLDAAFQPWWAKQQIITILLYFIEEWAVPRKKGKLAEKVDKVKLYDAYGAEIIDANGIPKTREPLPAMHEAVETWGSGGTIITPNGYELAIEEADPVMIEALMKAADWFNREISSAITYQFLSAGQGQKSGGEKGVSSHRDVLSLLILKLKNDQSMAIREQICKPIIAANFGKASKRFAPKVDLGDADGFPVGLDEMGFLAQSMPTFFTPEMFPEVGRKVGIPYIASANTVKVKRSAVKDANSLAAILSTKLNCSEGSFAIQVEG